MKLLTPLICTHSNDNRRWQIAPVPGGFYVERYNQTTDAIEQGYFFDTEISALRCMAHRAANEGFETDWSSLVVCQYYTVQSEYKGAAREEVVVFTTDEELDTFKRELLKTYKESARNPEDAGDVTALLAVGDIDAAWELATSEESEEKELWDTSFGSHHIETHEVKFTSLSPWIQASIKATVSA